MKKTNHYIVFWETINVKRTKKENFCWNLHSLPIQEKINSIFISKKEKSYHKNIIKIMEVLWRKKIRKGLLVIKNSLKKYVF